MSKKANPTVVGSFVLGAIALAVGSVLVLGGAKYFEEKFPCILYFDESIVGLDVGAPVDFQGVRIGTVTAVRLEVDRKAIGEIVRPVEIQIESSRIHFVDGVTHFGDTPELLDALVEESGLRARLAVQSMMTGKKMVELGFFPNQPVRRKNRQETLWEMPVTLSSLSQIQKEVTQLPLADIATDIHRTMKNLGDLLAPEKAGKLLTNINDTMEQLRGVLSRIDGKIDPLADQGTNVLAGVRATLGALNETLGTLQSNLEPVLQNVRAMSGNVNQMLQSDVEPLLKNLTAVSGDLSKMLQTDVEPLLKNLVAASGNFHQMMDPAAPDGGDLARLLSDLQAASKSLRRLTDYLEQHPESLIRGK